jgi:hypothetical protein
MRFKYIIYCTGIFFFTACAICPKIENIPKTGYKDEFSKTFVNFLKVISPNVNSERKEKVIVIISVKKYVSDFYMIKYSFLDLNNELASILEEWNKRNDYYLYL